MGGAGTGRQGPGGARRGQSFGQLPRTGQVEAPNLHGMAAQRDERGGGAGPAGRRFADPESLILSGERRPGDHPDGCVGPSGGDHSGPPSVLSGRPEDGARPDLEDVVRSGYGVRHPRENPHHAGQYVGRRRGPAAPGDGAWTGSERQFGAGGRDRDVRAGTPAPGHTADPAPSLSGRAGAAEASGASAASVASGVPSAPDQDRPDQDRSGTDSPTRPNSHRARARRTGPRGDVRPNHRATVLTALGAGLAIALPAILRLPSHPHVTLGGPEGSGPALGAPRGPASPTDSKGPTDPTGSANPTAGPGAASGRGLSPQTRNATAPQSPLSSPISVNGAVAPATASGPAGALGTQGGAGPAMVTASPASGPTAQISPDLAASYEDQVVALTNVQRAAAGCGPLRVDPRIRAAAVAHSVDMLLRHYFDHDTPDGETPWQRMADAGYTTPSAENIALGQATPQDVVTAWMDSPGHRANILNCSSHAVGVGVQFGPGGPWWTQDFGYV